MDLKYLYLQASGYDIGRLSSAITSLPDDFVPYEFFDRVLKRREDIRKSLEERGTETSFNREESIILGPPLTARGRSIRYGKSEEETPEDHNRPTFSVVITNTFIPDGRILYGFFDKINCPVSGDLRCYYESQDEPYSLFFVNPSPRKHLDFEFNGTLYKVICREDGLTVLNRPLEEIIKLQDHKVRKEREREKRLEENYKEIDKKYPKGSVEYRLAVMEAENDELEI